VKSFLPHSQEVSLKSGIFAELELYGHDPYYVTAYTNLLVISNIRHEIKVVLEMLRKMRKFESASAV